MTKTMLPPKKRDWKPGTTQLGLFIRDEAGRIIEFVSGPSGLNDIDTAAAFALLNRLCK
jgi:hypothetical protein